MCGCLLSIFLMIVSVLGNPFKLSSISGYRIVGGTEVIPHSLPYQAAVIGNQKWFCGGVLISTKYVLTVAHCTTRMTRITVILGAHDLKRNEDTRVVISNPTVINHPNYSETDLLNDISLLKLWPQVMITEAIKPIWLASATAEDFVGSTGVVSGWGYTLNGKQQSPRLRKARLDIISSWKCHLMLYSRLMIPSSQVCTSGWDTLIGPVGPCECDSGGPLVVDDTLVGLISYGHDVCDAGYPTVYTRISYHRDWISKHSGV